MKAYVLFDLDGTLLPIDTDLFLGAYLRLLGEFFADVAPPEVFARHVLESTVVTMRDPSGELTNKEKFLRSFMPRVGKSEAELMPRFDRFYSERFPMLSRHAKPSPLARALVQSALTKGYGIVMATNPVFPRAAVCERMRWAGVDDLPWSHITSYEGSRYCKPNPSYFSEIIETLGVEAQRSLHIGNDMEEDFAAIKAGLPVVMVSDFLINRGNRPMSDCLYHGTLTEVAHWFDNNLQCASAVTTQTRFRSYRGR